MITARITPNIGTWMKVTILVTFSRISIILIIWTENIFKATKCRTNIKVTLNFLDLPVEVQMKLNKLNEVLFHWYAIANIIHLFVGCNWLHIINTWAKIGANANIKSQKCDGNHYKQFTEYKFAHNKNAEYNWCSSIEFHAEKNCIQSKMFHCFSN